MFYIILIGIDFNIKLLHLLLRFNIKFNNCYKIRNYCTTSVWIYHRCAYFIVNAVHNVMLVLSFDWVCSVRNSTIQLKYWTVQVSYALLHAILIQNVKLYTGKHQFYRANSYHWSKLAIALFPTNRHCPYPTKIWDNNTSKY